MGGFVSLIFQIFILLNTVQTNIPSLITEHTQFYIIQEILSLIYQGIAKRYCPTDDSFVKDKFTDNCIKQHILLACMDYSKYLQCSECQEAGLYCKVHRIEVERELRAREIRKILKIKDHKSAQYAHALKGLPESYDIWKTIY